MSYRGRGGLRNGGFNDRRTKRENDSLQQKENEKRGSREQDKRPIKSAEERKKEQEEKLRRQEFQKKKLEEAIRREKAKSQNKPRINKKELRKEENALQQEEKIINASSTKNLISNSATTVPNVFQASLPWVGLSTQTSHPLNLLADLTVQDMVRAYPDLLDTVSGSPSSVRFGSVAYKLILIWALLTIVEEDGNLNGTKKYTIIPMPANIIIPKCWARVCAYFRKCKYEGAEYSFTYSYDTEIASPTWADINTATGLDVSTGWEADGTCYYNVAPKNESSSEVDYTYASSMSGIKTLVDAIRYSEGLSARISATGFGVPFGSIPKTAIDCSAYVAEWSESNGTDRVLTSTSTWFNTDFDPDVASILRGTEINGFYPCQKSAKKGYIVYPKKTNSSDVSYYAAGVLATANPFVFIVNRMKNPFGNWNYQGRPLKSVTAKYAKFDGASIATATFSSINSLKDIYQNIDSSFAGFSCQEVESMIVACYGAWYYRISQFKPLCFESNENRWFPSKVYSTLKLPPLVSQLIEDIGPVENNGQLILPYINQREAAAVQYIVDDYAINDVWDILQDHPSAISSNAWDGGIFNSMGITTKKAAVNWTISSTSINVAWTTAKTTRAAWPDRSLVQINKPMRNLMSKLNMADSFVGANYGPLGTRVNETMALQDKESFQEAISLALDDADNYIDWSLWHSCSRIDSPVPLGKKDLIMAQLMSIRSTWTDTTNAHYGRGMPHVLIFDGHTPDFIESLIAVCTTSMQPGGSYVLALGEARESQKVDTINVGTLEIDLSKKEVCRSYWCQLFGTLLDAASTYLAGRGGEVYLLPNIAKQIEKHAGKFMYQYTGELGVVAAKAVMSGVGIALETGLM